jgi:hypothetical protein
MKTFSFLLNFHSQQPDTGYVDGNFRFQLVLEAAGFYRNFFLKGEFEFYKFQGRKDEVEDILTVLSLGTGRQPMLSVPR